MNEIFQALVLGVVQGLTEFLPVSSTGHLILFPWLFNWNGVVNSLPFDLALHTGTLLAVFLFFWKDWVDLVTAFLKNLSGGWSKLWADMNSRLFLLLVIGSVPAGIFGVLLDKLAEEKLRSPLLIALAMIGFGCILYWADSFNGKREMGKLTLKDSILIGFAQVIALVPGISRSGSTITGGLFLGLDRKTATKFSFLLSTPIIAGAALFKFKDMVKEGGLGGNSIVFLVGLLAAAISGWLAIRFMLRYVQSNKFTIFVFYRFVIGAFILLVLLTGK